MRFNLVCAAALFASLSVFAQDPAGPFGYPAGLLDAPATLSSPAADYLRLGKPKAALERTKLEDVARLTQGTRLSEGSGVYRRDTLCLTGTEGGRPVVAWLIATASEYITEAQLEWVKPGEIPGYCRALPGRLLPLRLGKIGLGMTKADVQKELGDPSHVDSAGWHYWFSQRFSRNERDLQELRLNWLAVQYDRRGRIKKAFISQVTNL